MVIEDCGDVASGSWFSGVDWWKWLTELARPGMLYES